MEEEKGEVIWKSKPDSGLYYLFSVISGMLLFFGTYLFIMMLIFIIPDITDFTWKTQQTVAVILGFVITTPIYFYFFLVPLFQNFVDKFLGFGLDYVMYL